MVANKCSLCGWLDSTEKVAQHNLHVSGGLERAYQWSMWPAKEPVTGFRILAPADTVPKLLQEQEGTVSGLYEAQVDALAAEPQTELPL